jgi:hypothetical protein
MEFSPLGNHGSKVHILVSEKLAFLYTEENNWLLFSDFKFYF